MFLLESEKDIADAQRMLEQTICNDLTKGATAIGNIAKTNTLDSGTHWFRSKDHQVNGALKRRLNFFGLSGDDNAVVQINIPYHGLNNAIAGFFAKEGEKIYLFHSGAVGGGEPGVGQREFLAWCDETNQNLVFQDVENSLGRVRKGILVMPIEGEMATDSVIRYIDIIHRFKQQVIPKL